ncbi:MAG: hypothetical protein J6T51_02015 [Kiritimatiellae bacterium]|nr:hypothetical protein [Kiritimatiellia bacterium]
MATGKALDGKPYAGNPHVRFEGRASVCAATPRRGSLLYNLAKMFSALTAIFFAVGSTGNAAVEESRTGLKENLLSLLRIPSITSSVEENNRAVGVLKARSARFAVYAGDGARGVGVFVRRSREGDFQHRKGQMKGQAK